MKTGKIIKINKDIGYGFIKFDKNKIGTFTTKTAFENSTFDSIKIGDSVFFVAEKTLRGLYVNRLELIHER